MPAKSYKSDQVSLIKNDGIKYAVTVGRRQPMHAMHADSVREILNEGLFLIYVIGSVNKAYDENGDPDKLYDPVRNPLTYEQQRAQFFAAFPDMYDMERIKYESLDSKPNVVIFPHKDLGNLSLWSQKLCDVLADRDFMKSQGIEEKKTVLEKAVLHFRGKQKDRKNINIKVDTTDIMMTNVWDINALREYGLAVWYSVNPREEQYKINSTELRVVDLHSEKAKEIVAYEYICKLAENARKNDPDNEFLRKSWIPLTMFDITLQRMREELGISTGQIFEMAEMKNLESMIKSAQNILARNVGEKKWRSG